LSVVEHILRQVYPVSTAGVTLTLFPGDGQQCVARVCINGHAVPEQPGARRRYELGSGAELAGRILTIESRVTPQWPVRGARAEITYALEGGREDKAFQQEAALEGPLGTVAFLASFALLDPTDVVRMPASFEAARMERSGSRPGSNP
jgi:hypothetical protein